MNFVFSPRIASIIALMLVCSLLSGQDVEYNLPFNGPPVSVMGEDELLPALLSRSHPGNFLSVCGEDMVFAYEKWMEMLGEMEDYSREKGLDLDGLKIYMQVYWNADGTIAHVAFYPRDNPESLQFKELKTFLAGFVDLYQLPLQSDRGFSHFGTAVFPTDSRPQYNVRKDD